MPAPRRLLSLPPILLASLVATVLAAQEQEEAPPQEEPRPSVPSPEQMFPDDDLRQELIRIFHEVERNLRRIDDGLADAGAGYVPLDEVGESGIDDLLRATAAESSRAVQGIERILEIAQQLGDQQSSSSGSSQNQQRSSSDSPLDQQRDRGPTEQEQTPSTPEPGEEEGHEQQESQEDREKRGDQPDRGPGENRPGTPQDDAQGVRQDGAEDDATWGNLPERYPQVFRNQGADQVPIQYRDWIEAYFRRLSRETR